MKRSVLLFLVSIQILLSTAVIFFSPMTFVDAESRNTLQSRWATQVFQVSVPARPPLDVMRQLIGDTRPYTRTPGWSGTLRRQGDPGMNGPHNIIATFAGTVTCSLACAFEEELTP